MIKPATLFDNPIEDTDLLVKPFIRKLQEGEEFLPVRPAPRREFGSVSSEHVLSLLRSFNFLQIFGRPLRLYPFQVCNDYSLTPLSISLIPFSATCLTQATRFPLKLLPSHSDLSWPLRVTSIKAKRTAQPCIIHTMSAPSGQTLMETTAVFHTLTRPLEKSCRP